MLVWVLLESWLSETLVTAIFGDSKPCCFKHVTRNDHNFMGENERHSYCSNETRMKSDSLL